MKKTQLEVSLVIGLTIAFSLAIRTGAATPFTVSDTNITVRSGDISKKEVTPEPNSDSSSTATKGDIFTRDLQVGSKGADVTALQNLLGVTPAIGVFGELTKEAVIKYQLSKGISPATGYVGEKTRASLEKDAAAKANISIPSTATKRDVFTKDLPTGSKEKEAATKADVSSPSTAAKGDIFTRDLQVGSRGADVTALQNLLRVTPAIGVFGELTKEAVIKYQLSKGISPATGHVGEQTRASLEKDAAAKANVSGPSTAAKADVVTKDLQAGSKEKEAATKANISSPSTAAKGDIFTRDLQVGSRGADVTALQNLLGVTPAIRVFGDLTKEAVIKYQLSKGISPATGHVGEKTRASLEKDAAARAIVSSSINSNET